MIPRGHRAALEFAAFIVEYPQQTRGLVIGFGRHSQRLPLGPGTTSPAGISFRERLHVSEPEVTLSQPANEVSAAVCRFYSIFLPPKKKSLASRPGSPGGFKIFRIGEENS